MQKEIIEIDFGDSRAAAAARRFQRGHQDLTLGELLQKFPARFPKDSGPDRRILDLRLEKIIFQPVRLAGDNDQAVPENLSSPHLPEVDPLDGLDQIWEQETAKPPVPLSATGFPERITDNQAVRIAYREEMDSISDYLKHGLSVLVVCDKMLTEYLYERVCLQAGKTPVLDAARPEEMREGIAGELDRALAGGYSNLPVLLRNLKPDEVLVLRSLDLLNEGPTIETLYERTVAGDKPQLLAFLDPSLEVQKVLSDRFAVHIRISGLPRYPAAGPTDDAATGAGENRKFTVSRLLTARERECFADFDPENLFKNVSGLNAIQFRNAMRYVGAKVAPQTPAKEIYREIREFKITSGSEVEVPDTTFDDIGGYDHIKRQLKHVISLIAGDIKALDDDQRARLLPRGFIFHGPPGTGKTLFAKAVANELNATIQMVSGPEIMDKYVGQSENNLRQLFATARRNAPAVIFFDEFDSIASQRSVYADGGARANNAVVAQLLTEMDGFRRDQAVIVIGTSNRIDIIDEALLRPSRLKPVEIGLPDLEARRQVARIHAIGFNLDRYFADLAGAREKPENCTRPEEFAELKRQLEEFAARQLGSDDFLAAIIDLVALHSEGFNNDEIRAVFQEASLEHHLEGRVLSPRFFGEKLAALIRRRQERRHVHL